MEQKMSERVFTRSQLVAAHAAWERHLRADPASFLAREEIEQQTPEEAAEDAVRAVERYIDGELPEAA
jgi:hypothetical protein